MRVVDYDNAFYLANYSISFENEGILLKGRLCGWC